MSPCLNIISGGDPLLKLEKYCHNEETLLLYVKTYILYLSYSTKVTFTYKSKGTHYTKWPII